MQVSKQYELNNAARLSLAATPFTGLDAMHGFIGTLEHDNGISMMVARPGSGGRMRCRRI